MLTHGAFEDPEFIKCSQWLDKFRTEYQRVIVNDLWYERFGMFSLPLAASNEDAGRIRNVSGAS